MSFRIIGTGSQKPACVKTNEDLTQFLDTSDEWITTRTGIKERRIITTETLSELATKAAEHALEMAGVKAEDLDFIICSTIRGDYITPSLACVVGKNLGAHCPAFDVNAACSGFIYAMDCAAGYFERGRAEHILVVSAEAMSKMVDWHDRATCVLFGDSAGAVVMEKGDSLLSIRLTAEGNTDFLRIPNVNGNSPFSDSVEEPHYLYMDGQNVYKFAVNAMSTDLKWVIEQAGLTQDDVDHVLPHQANIRIIETAMRKLKIPHDRYHINILAVKTGDELRPMPGANYAFTGTEHILALAGREDVRKLLRKVESNSSFE